MKYFLHDTGSFQDEKITELYMAFGYEGLGLFYTVLEKLAYQEKPIKTAVLKQQLNVGKKLEKCWSFMESLGILSSNNGETFNNKLTKFNETFQQSKEKNKKRVSDWRDKQALTEDVTHYESVRNAPNSIVYNSIVSNSIVKPSLRSGGAATAADDFPLEKLELETEKKRLEILPLETPAAIASHTGGAADVATRKVVRPRKVLLSDSLLATPEAFAAAWDAAAAANPATYAPFAGVDLAHYHAALGDWSAANGAKKFDWLATLLGSMRRDLTDGRLRTLHANPNLTPHAIRRSGTLAPNSAAGRLQVQQPDASAGWGYPGGNRPAAPAGSAGAVVGHSANGGGN